MRLYIETSVIGFWFDTKLHNRQKRRATRRLFLLCRRGVHEAFISDVFLQEIRQSPPKYRDRDLDLVRRLSFKQLQVGSPLLERLVEAYRVHPVLAKVPEADLQHIAAYAVSVIDALVTYNLRHLANQIILDGVREVNHAQGIDKELRVAPPEAFLPPRTV